MPSCMMGVSKLALLLQYEYGSCVYFELVIIILLTYDADESERSVVGFIPVELDVRYILVSCILV